MHQKKQHCVSQELFIHDYVDMLKFQGHTLHITHDITRFIKFTFSHLADVFIQSDLQTRKHWKKLKQYRQQNA